MLPQKGKPVTNSTTAAGGGVRAEAVSNSGFCSFKPKYLEPN